MKIFLLKSKMKMESGHEMFSMKVEFSKRNTMFRNKIMINKGDTNDNG